MIDSDRRSGERLPVAPLSARLSSQPVRVVDIGPTGSRVEHDSPLVSGARDILRLQWEGEEFTVDCAVVRCEESGARRYASGLTFPAAPAPFRRMLAALADRDELDRLRTLVEASKLINSSIDPDTLFASILTVARNELGVERGTLYFVEEERQEIRAKIAGDFNAGEIRLPFGHGIAGTVAATGEPVIIHDAYADPRFDQSADRRSGFRTRSILCVPIRNREQRIVGVLQLLNKNTGSFGRRDLEFLSGISEHMAIAMENARMHMEILDKQRMERELQLGREIQGRLFPLPPSDIRGIELAATSVPCYEVGGDYYDFLELPNGDLGLVIADVSGKGVSAAIIMSSVQAALRVAAAIEDDLSMLVARLNALLFRMTRGRKYVTFFFGRYDPRSGVLRFVNAGHNPPVLADGIGLRTLDATGKPIGLLPDVSYTTSSVTIPIDATLYLYTDGLNEAANRDDEEFGTDRLEQTFAAVASSDTAAIPAMVLDVISRFELGAHATDDKTLVVMKRTG
jgi:sigma-B regulation protein RsbU (phosphoserine phosphatase)